MILGLTGLKGSGKDTVGAYLIKNYNFERRSFADKLKESYAALFNIEPWEIEQLKNDPTAMVYIINRDPDAIGGLGNSTSSMSVRESLQRYGTESHRDVFGVDFWVEQCLPINGFYSGKAIVITDLRFESEARRVREIGGKIIRIERPALDSKDPHRSEQEQLSIRVDYTLTNDGTLEDLYEAVETMLVEI